ncbi:ferritin family protein [Streptosporangium sandarakinum]|uniref:ferritin family protein n=1 Tax=Streptosporangium sandarakinum TaxID=1260955 RepID=UPI0033ABBBA3
MGERVRAWRTAGIAVLGATTLLAGAAIEAAALSAGAATGTAAGAAGCAAAGGGPGDGGERGDSGERGDGGDLGAGGVSAPTWADLMKAIQGEAFAYAKYRAYAAQACRENLPDVQALYERVARVELREHLAGQARLAGLAGDDAANLRAAISGAFYEAKTMYPGFAAQARAAGDRDAARLFSEIAGDEAGHRARSARALRALEHPSSGASVPVGPAARSVSVPEGSPQVSSRTLEDLRTAMRGEALAHARYGLYAEHARANGRPRLAMLFEHAAQVELTEHFAEEARLAGLVRSTAANLCESAAGETREGTDTYPGYARRAAAAGDRAAAERFSEIARDKLRHAEEFKDALSGLGANCPPDG